ncbi:uncharacterized protein LOC129001217 isoform X2 [Macrosteles quadrilineatus]|nr:uncharacterized protein LOC129001217 isoform X2 [Macrosteles quadrilineatus]
MPLRDLRRLWGTRKQSAVPSDSGGEEGGGAEVRGHLCALPLLQVWPSQDSPRGEADGQSFVFPADEATAHQNDSGIESVQASPSPGVQCERQVAPASPSPSVSASVSGRRSSTLLHPDHARLLIRRPSTPEPQEEPQSPSSPSTASSMTSVAGAAVASLASRHSDPWDRRRRSSTVTARYSLLDALDLEYALLRAAARGSVGPYSLSESIHKLTFTQSLAFPALARGLAGKRRPSQTHPPPLDPSESGLNAFAKIVTALVLMLVSVMVFGVVYKYVRT